MPRPLVEQAASSVADKAGAEPITARQTAAEAVSAGRLRLLGSLSVWLPVVPVTGKGSIDLGGCVGTS